MHYDPASMNRGPSSRSVSQATSARTSGVEDRLRQAEMIWRSKLAQDQGRRQDAMARARYYEEAHRERAAAKLSAEEAEAEEVQRRNASEIQHRVSQRRANSAALSRRMELQRIADARAADRKRAQLEDKLQSGIVRHSQQINSRRSSIAQQRSFRQAVQVANIRQLEKHRSELTTRVIENQYSEHPFARSGSVATTMTARSSSRAPNHVAATAQRAAEIQELKTLERLRKMNEEEQRSQAALARKQEELEERRVQKSVKELQARARVQRSERMQELAARRYEARFQEAVEVGNRVAAFNSVCRVNY